MDHVPCVFIPGTQPLYYPSLTPSSMGFSSMRSLPLTSSSPAVSQYAPPPGPMFHPQIRPLQANRPMPMHAQPVVQQGFRPGPAAPQQQPQQHLRPPTQQPTRGDQFPPPATLPSQPSTEKITPTTSLPQTGKYSYQIRMNVLTCSFHVYHKIPLSNSQLVFRPSQLCTFQSNILIL